MRQAVFFGHLGRDADVRYTANGTAVCNFPLGVNAGRGQEQKTLWIDCALFGNRATGNLPSYLTKGVGIVVSGEVDLRTFQKQDGSMGAAISLAVGQISFGGGGAAPAGGQNPAQQQPQQQQPQQQRPPQQQQPPQQPQQQPQQGPDPVDDFDDDIPFD